MIKFKGYSVINGKIISGIDKIVESINILFSTSMGTRVYDYNYGNRISEQLFEVYDESVNPIIISYVEGTISKERRVTVETGSVKVDKMSDTEISISFNLIYKGARINFIYYREIK